MVRSLSKFWDTLFVVIMVVIAAFGVAAGVTSVFAPVYAAGTDNCGFVDVLGLENPNKLFTPGMTFVLIKYALNPQRPIDKIAKLNTPLITRHRDGLGPLRSSVAGINDGLRIPNACSSSSLGSAGSILS